MHYSCVSIPSALAYSPDSAVLLSKLLKGSISFIIVLILSPILSPDHPRHYLHICHYRNPSSSSTGHQKPGSLILWQSGLFLILQQCSQAITRPSGLFLSLIKGPLKLSNDSIPSANFYMAGRIPCTCSCGQEVIYATKHNHLNGGGKIALWTRAVAEGKSLNTQEQKPTPLLSGSKKQASSNPDQDDGCKWCKAALPRTRNPPKTRSQCCSTCSLGA